MTGKLGTSVSRVLLGMLEAAALAAGSITAQAAPISGQGTWETTLQPRDLDGDPTTIEAWYDTVLDCCGLNIRWSTTHGPRRWPGPPVSTSTA